MTAISYRQAALDTAVTQLGVTEHPPASNWGPEVKQYLASAGITYPAPWCMAFVHWCYLQVGYELGGYASVQRFEDWAKANGDLVTRPFRGDIVCYDWDGGGWADHCGIVAKVLALRWRDRVFAGWVKTVEGNTAVGNDSNGGKVMYRRRWIGTAKFARITGLTGGAATSGFMK